ncbi:MAG: alpha/beta hydrolase-fold protein [Sphingomonas fennica]
MVTALLAAAALAAAAAAAPAPQAPPPAAAPYVIPRTAVTTLSAADGTPYRLFAAWPDGVPPATGWPLLVVLDGADNFAVTVESLRRMARGGRSGIAEGVVIGIDSGTVARRVLDYTPAVPGYAIPAGLPAAGRAIGGADAFLGFVEGRVLPWVAGEWPTDPNRRTIAGHSFGGLLALHAAATRPGLFARHAAISPSLWYGDGAAAREAAAIAQPAHLFLAAGTAERGPGGDTPAAIEAVAGAIRAHGGDVRTLPIVGQGHGTTMLAATGPLIAFAFGEPPALSRSRPHPPARTAP